MPVQSQEPAVKWLSSFQDQLSGESYILCIDIWMNNKSSLSQIQIFFHMIVCLCIMCF